MSKITDNESPSIFKLFTFQVDSCEDPRIFPKNTFPPKRTKLNQELGLLLVILKDDSYLNKLLILMRNVLTEDQLTEFRKMETDRARYIDRLTKVLWEAEPWHVSPQVPVVALYRRILDWIKDQNRSPFREQNPIRISRMIQMPINNGASFEACEAIGCPRRHTIYTTRTHCPKCHVLFHEQCGVLDEGDVCIACRGHPCDFDDEVE